MGIYYFFGAWLGLILGLIVFFSVGARRRSSVPLLFSWLFLVAGIVAVGYSLSHSTAPSYAPRITSTGKATALVEKRMGKESKFCFRFEPENGEPIEIETHIIVPHWSDSESSSGRTYRIVYLKDSDRNPKNEAIEIEIISGRNAGWHDSLDARPLGAWLWVPLGGMLGTIGLFGIKYNKDDVETAASTDDSTPNSTVAPGSPATRQLLYGKEL